MLRKQEKEEMAFRAKVVEEEEARRRVEEGVACRLEQELEKRSEEIEGEVERRVAAAKLEMEVGWGRCAFMYELHITMLLCRPLC